MKTNHLKKQVKGAIRANDYYSQIDFLVELTQRKPENLKYKYELAKAYDKSRDYQRALDEYSKVFYADQEKYAIAIYHMGRIMKTREQYKLATLYFNQFIDKHNNSKESRHYKKLVKAELEGCKLGLQKSMDTPNTEIFPLKGNVNRSNIEFSPNIIDNNTIWFVSLPSDEIVFLESDTMPKRRIYLANERNGKWNVDSLLSHPSNSGKEHIGSFSISKDKQRMYLSLCKPNWQNKMVCNIYLSKLENEGWGEPEILPEEVHQSNHTYTQPCVGASSKKDREIIYFVSDKKGGKGGYDIWYTRYRISKRKFDKARNAGSKINSIGDEMTPSFDFSTNKLYFSSNGRAGIGGFDLFEAVGERSKWMYPAVNSGKNINSSYDDMYYVAFPKNRSRGLLVSNREGSIDLKHPYCCDDIFEVNWKKVIEVEYNLKFVDEKTKKPLTNVELIVAVKDSPDGEIIVLQRIRTDNMGKVQLNLQPGIDFQLIAESDIHFNKQIHVSTKGLDESSRKEKTIMLSAIPKDEIIIPNIYYPFDKAYLTPEAKTAIDTSIYELLIENPTLIVEIGSHTDSKGTEKYNQHLSQKRAQSVVNYLVEKGVNKKRLAAKGYGESKPIKPNILADGSDNPKGRARNRRTAFKVIGELEMDVYYEEE